jgi:hypothetical protein
MTWLLLVTWFMPVTANSYQVAFESAALCEAAKNELQADADRRRAQAEAVFKRANPNVAPPLLYPKLSAICVRQKNSN